MRSGRFFISIIETPIFDATQCVFSSPLRTKFSPPHEGGFLWAKRMQTQDGFYTTEKLSAHKEMTPEGYLLCKDVTISRVGDFDYLSSEVDVPSSTGKVKVTRTAEELFKDETIASFEGKPVTIGHRGFVTPENHNALSVGTVANVRRKGDELVADLLITSQEGIDIIQSGRLDEVSCGYDARTIPDGDGKGHQEGIVGNHVAIVEEARYGSTCQIKDGFMDNEKGLLDTLLELFKKGDKEAVLKAVEEAMPEEEQPKDIVVQEEPKADEEPKAEETADEEGEAQEEGEESVEARMTRLEAKLAGIEAKLEAKYAEDACKDEEAEEEVSEKEVQAVLADADDLCEGMKKPIGDAKGGKFTQDGLDRVMRTAIKGSGIDVYGDVAELEGQALKMAFKGAVALRRATKNPTVHVGDSKTIRKSVNDFNNEFWSR